MSIARFEFFRPGSSLASRTSSDIRQQADNHRIRQKPGCREAVVSKLCQDYWDWRLSDSPEFSSYCGNHSHDDRFDQVTEEHFLKTKITIEEFLSKASGLDSATLGEESRLDLELLKEELRTTLNGYGCRGYLYPINFMEGIHVDSHDIVDWMKFETSDDYEKYLRRLDDFPRRCRDTQTILMKGVQDGLTNHQVSMMGVIKQFEALESETDEISRFLAPFKKQPSNMDDHIFEKFKAEARKRIEAKVIPASQKLKEYIRDVYMEHLRPSIGVCSLPGGKDFYQKCLDFHLSVQMAPQEVHQLGLQEVERIKQAMATLIESEGYNSKDFTSFLKSLKAKKEFFFKTPGELLDYIKYICYEKIRPALPELFKDIPESHMDIVEAPGFLSNAPVGFYRAGTVDGSRAGVYTMNTSKLQACPKYELMALSLHEGEPGHHFQAVNTFAQKGLPGFRQYVEDMKYYSAPTRFPLYTANVEGWGLYSEALGEEMQLYEDNFSMIGRYSFEIHRAARLVVDTGMHAMGWSREDGVKYLSHNSTLDEWFINNEINRYITWPGQACAYKIGELKIWELRRHAEKQLGEQFDIKEFHAIMLKCGPVPLHINESMVNQYIQDTIKP